MREVVVEETMSDMDADKDGFVTLDEYISEFISLALRHTKHGSLSCSVVLPSSDPLQLLVSSSQPTF